MLSEIFKEVIEQNEAEIIEAHKQAQAEPVVCKTFTYAKYNLKIAMQIAADNVQINTAMRMSDTHEAVFNSIADVHGDIIAAAKEASKEYAFMWVNKL